MYYKKDILLGFLCTVVLIAVACFGVAGESGNPWDYIALPRLTIPVYNSAKVLGLSFNGTGSPVVLIEEKGTGDLKAIQYQDIDGDKVYEPTFVYDIVTYK